MEQEQRMKTVVVDDKPIAQALNVIISLPKPRVNVRWFMGFQDFIIELAKEDLTKLDYQVLLFLLGNMDFENWVQVSQETIAREVGASRRRVISSLKKLAEKNIIEISKRGRMNIYRLNPEIVWKGSYKKLQEHIRDKIVSFPNSTGRE